VDADHEAITRRGGKRKDHAVMLTYGEITRDETKLPQTSVQALLSRGFSHYMGNEQASKVVAKIRTSIATSLSTPDKEVNQVDVTREQVGKFRETNAKDVEGWTQEVYAAALAALDNGTVGVSTRGPTKDPIETEMRAYAKSLVVAKLKAGGLVVPKGEETITSGGKQYTIDDLIGRQIAKDEGTIRKHAERKIAERAREKARAEQEAAKLAGAGPVSFESLGL